MRDKLQALVDEIKENGIRLDEWVMLELESILATETPAVTVRAGWVCKGPIGLHWTSERPEWFGSFGWSCFHDALIVDECITDPWPDKPNGGPECLLEIK